MATVFFGNDIHGNDNIGLPFSKIATKNEEVETVFDGMQTLSATGITCQTACYKCHERFNDVSENAVFVVPGSVIVDDLGKSYRLSHVRADDINEAVMLLGLGFLVKL